MKPPIFLPALRQRCFSINQLPSFPTPPDSGEAPQTNSWTWRSSSDQTLDLEKLFRPTLGPGDTLQTNSWTWRSSSDQPLDLEKLFRPTFGSGDALQINPWTSKSSSDQPLDLKSSSDQPLDLQKLFRPTFGHGKALQTKLWTWRSSSDQPLDISLLPSPATQHISSHSHARKELLSHAAQGRGRWGASHVPKRCKMLPGHLSTALFPSRKTRWPSCKHRPKTRWRPVLLLPKTSVLRR